MNSRSPLLQSSSQRIASKSGHYLGSSSTLTNPTFSSSARYNQTIAERNDALKRNPSAVSGKKKKVKKPTRQPSPLLRNILNSGTVNSHRNTYGTTPSSSNLPNRAQSAPSQTFSLSQSRLSNQQQYVEQLKKFESLFNKYQLLYNQQKSKTNSMEKKIASLQEKMMEMDLQMTAQSKKCGSLKNRMDSLEGSVSNQKKTLEELFTLHETKLKIFEDRLAELKDIQARYRKKTAYLQKKFKEFSKRKPEDNDEPGEIPANKDDSRTHIDELLYFGTLHLTLSVSAVFI
ncbi:hypothetical protein C9374_008081 [Naegleria lovaniensis]|uniref:Uncharacterized protein n=1 Tax=Naegleria lovaniensis TaxID=51637 RepID=A0AA88GFD8_NAELO|nr:uncharacterized protein C9374_008081 [Naegleria lovaniensis]KAG2378442.1 hypothetical protein C9374_008081 [Naegleria lovaniensis]